MHFRINQSVWLTQKVVLQFGFKIMTKYSTLEELIWKYSYEVDAFL